MMYLSVFLDMLLVSSLLVLLTTLPVVSTTPDSSFVSAGFPVAVSGLQAYSALTGPAIVLDLSEVQI